MGQHDSNNSFIMSRVNLSGDLELDKASWEKSAAEFADGALQGPYFSVKEVEQRFGTVRLLPRFLIWEQHGGAEQQVASFP